MKKSVMVPKTPGRERSALSAEQVVDFVDSLLYAPEPPVTPPEGAGKKLRRIHADMVELRLALRGLAGGDLRLRLTARGCTADMLRELIVGVRALEESCEDYKRLATVDSLTGLFNRRHLLNVGGAELSRAQRHNRPLGVLMLDIDHFKTVNDTYGHQGGDEVLQQFGCLLRQSVRLEDIVARYGGEEFVILLTDCDIEGSRSIAERIRRACDAAPFRLSDGTAVHRTVSVGLTQATAEDFALPGERASVLEHVIARADEALYKAKEGGRNRIAEG